MAGSKREIDFDIATIGIPPTMLLNLFRQHGAPIPQNPWAHKFRHMGNFLNDCVG
jgi:hypothetical protein